MRSRILLLLVFTLLACNPQSGDEYKAVVSFTNAKHTIDVHIFFNVQYQSAIQYDAVHVIPMLEGDANIFELTLSDVESSSISAMSIQVQQGYVVQDTCYNMFKVSIFCNGVFIWESSNGPNENSAYYKIIN